MRMHRGQRVSSGLTRRVAAAGAMAVVLGGVAACGNPQPVSFGATPAHHFTCSAPALPGTVVDVAVGNMGGWMTPQGHGNVMMGRGMMGDGHMGGTMTLALSRSQVPAGTVSFRVRNFGTMVHEMVVLKLAKGQSAGSLALDSENRVSEDSSVGEVSAQCAPDAGEGIEPKGMGWGTLHLKPGSYALVCNLAGHYVAGMWAELEVV